MNFNELEWDKSNLPCKERCYEMLKVLMKKLHELFVEWETRKEGARVEEHCDILEGEVMALATELGMFREIAMAMRWTHEEKKAVNFVRELCLRN